MPFKLVGERFPEIIVVDGDPGGSTINAIHNKEIITLQSPKGRSMQMNRGAQAASGDILLFLHADTYLPETAMKSIKGKMASGKYAAGAFNLSSKGMNLFMKHIYITHYWRSCITRIAYGDQAIFILKDYFMQLGGYPEIPIMEEVVLMKKIKQNKDKICILKDKVRTSPRRYDEDGQVFNWLRNHRIRILYCFGKEPEELAKLYPETRRKNR